MAEYLPREYWAGGSRLVAEQNIPIVSGIAAKDAQAADELWQAYHGVDLEGNSLGFEERNWLAQDAGRLEFEVGMETAALLLTAKGALDVGQSTVQYYRSSPTSSSTIQQNKAAGEAFEDEVFANLKGFVRQVTIKTQSGIKTRLDGVGRDASGSTTCIECKASATAPLTKNQKAAFPEIEVSGATVVGQGKPGFPGGTQIPPTKVQIIRPHNLKE